MSDQVGVRFKVTPASVVAEERKVEENEVKPSTAKMENVPLVPDEFCTGGLALFEDEIERRPRVSQFIATVQNYTNLTQGAVEHAAEEAGEAPSEKMGTLAGVYLPTIQNIFGVILFLRFTWIVGLAGIYHTFLLVFICCATTMLTAFSMSAIATNGVVPAGGAYFMISRALGPEFGGAVGILFYLGTTFGSAMYILGGVEILIKYLAPGAIVHTLGNDDDSVILNNMRLYGTIFLLLMSCLVFVGVKYVNKAAFFLLVIVLLSISSIYAGLVKTLVINPDTSSESCETCFCVLGERLLHATEDALCYKFIDYKNGTGENKTNLQPTDLWRIYCAGEFNSSEPENFENCDQYFAQYSLVLRNGFPGLGKKNSSHSSNLYTNYLAEGGNIVDKNAEERNYDDPQLLIILQNETADNHTAYHDDYPSWIEADVTSSFTVLLGIFFPSVTGIMAGSNRSGDLKDAQASIPTGTIAAIATTSIVYLSCTILFGCAVDRLLLLDKFGESLQYGHGGKMVASLLVWPTANFLVIGAFLSTIGAGLQSLTGAPRLLQAISKDNVIPFLSIFAAGNKNGEPTWALLITALISETGILIAELDYVAPILTMFFLMCYMFVNLACVLQIMLRTPSWRPRFKYYHWAASLLGMVMCIALMFICSWLYALVALALAAFVYKYIEYKGAEKEWGDGMKGLQMSSARYALLRLNDGVPHTKNWRPQILLLTKLDTNYAVKDDKILDFVTQLKAGKGLVMVSAVLQGDFLLNYAESQTAEEVLKRSLKEHQIKGFSSVLISKNIEEGLCSLIQTSGLGGLRHNTVMAGWPQDWKKSSDSSGYKRFLSIVRASGAGHHSLIIPKNVQLFPQKTERIEGGTIDVWWIVHDGGLLTLLPHLLKQHKVWKDCRTRIFTVAQMEDNSLQMKQALTLHLYQLRIDAEVKVVELDASDVSAYTYERTLIMEQRNQLIRNLRATRRRGDQGGQNFLNNISSSSRGNMESNELTWTQIQPPPQNSSNTIDNIQNLSQMFDITPDQPNLRRMHNAVKLNEVIVTESHDAQLVILNLPGPPKKNTNDCNAHNKERNYMEFLEVLTEGLDRVLMVRGGGREVVTIYN